MSLILFVFLGLLVLAIASGDKVEAMDYESRTKRKFAWFNERLKKWEDSVVDRAMEEDLYYFIRDPSNYAAVWEEVHAAYQEMPSRKDYTEILLNEYYVKRRYGTTYTKKQRENIAEANCKLALNIMMARRGKAPRSATDTVLDLEWLGEGIAQHSKARWDRDFEVWLYIQNELRRHGVPARLIFRTNEHLECEQTVYDADDVEKFHYKPGRLAWLPVTFFDDELKCVE